MRRTLGLPLDHILLLYFGRIDYATKGDLAPLFPVYRKLMDKYGKGLTLVIAGAGSSERIEQLKQIVEACGGANHVLVRPFPTMKEAPLYYSASDIFVSLSDTIQESFGLTPLEAMSSGLPVVVTDWSGYKETVIHGTTGFRVTTRWFHCDQDLCLFSPLNTWEEDHRRLSQSVAADTEELFQYLDLLIGNADRRADMGRAARQHIRLNYDWKPVMARLYSLWLELSDVSSNIPSERLGCCTSLPADYSNFSRFATLQIDDAMRLEITEQGQRFYRHPDGVRIYPELRRFLQIETLVVLLKFIARTNLLRCSPSVRDVANVMGRKHQIPYQDVAAHIMWLLKQGMIRVHDGHQANNPVP